ncbi:DASH family cryptochrome [Exiguobacterium sp. TBG-PICH-001]|uniref:DASH family cryptochrome n=1 Tax=Exiguobacterium abrahamii TaxID=2785532 RepID=UPI0018A6E0C6|nr:DASH family cryptochrome [Exiguobacterium sp. TBG-PICH-001]MBF8152345.1 DASH family cryptochrome [Exiguobacterium sp. TBG-PICH-001]
MGAVVWYRHDLRVDDHEALRSACEEQDVIRAVYVKDQRKRDFKRGTQQARFEQETLENLADHLSQIGIALDIVEGEINETLDSYLQADDTIYFHKMTGTEEAASEQYIEDRYAVRSFETQTLHRREDIGSDELKRVFTAFRKRVEAKGTFYDPLDPPTGIQLVKEESVEANHEIAFPFRGGESAGRARLQEYLDEPVFTYKETRNGFLRNDSSKLSAWLANGSLSPRRVMAELQEAERKQGANESTYWLYFELLWRDFFHLTMRETGSRLFRSSGLKEGQRTWKTDQLAVERWIEGKTGVPFVDAFMNEIRETGWMSNRGRQIVASYLIHELKQDWRIGARYFEQQLIDYDVASNYGNWAFIAGVGNATRTPRFDPAFQQQRYDPNQQFTKRWT